VSKLRPIILWYLVVQTDLRLTGTAGFPHSLSADASLDLRGSEAAGLWNTASHGSVELEGVLVRVPHSLRSAL